MGKSSINGPFSMAMLDNQMVAIEHGHGNSGFTHWTWRSTLRVTLADSNRTSGLKFLRLNTNQESSRDPLVFFLIFREF